MSTETNPESLRKQACILIKQLIIDGELAAGEAIVETDLAGCNLQLFTTGRGTPVGGPCVPTIKVTANRRTQDLRGESNKFRLILH